MFLSQLGIAVITFIVTNIDDLLTLRFYFSNPRFKTAGVVLGQYVGIISLIVISLIGLLLGEVLAEQWISLLGILPLMIGFKSLLALRQVNDDDADSDRLGTSRFQFISVALVTVANGGDNIGVYGPLFATMNKQYLWLFLLTFMLMTAVWCVLAFYFVKHPRIKNIMARFGKLILPIFLIALGLYILKDFIVWMFS